MIVEEFSLDTRGKRVVDVTDRVTSFAASAGADGLLHVFAPHATAGLALMETGSGSEHDLGELLVHHPVHEVIAIQSSVDREWLPKAIDQRKAEQRMKGKPVTGAARSSRAPPSRSSIGGSRRRRTRCGSWRSGPS